MKLQMALFDAFDRLCGRSTEDQSPLPRSQALKSAGCAETHEEQASGGNRARPALVGVLERIGKGDKLVVVRIDRLARSLSHLLEVIERLEAKGAFFRSIQDPIDTASPQGKCTLQVLADPSPPFLRLDRSLILNTAQVRRLVMKDRNSCLVTLEGQEDPLVLGRAALSRLRAALTAG